MRRQVLADHKAWMVIPSTVEFPEGKLLRKEVIQPQIPLRLPCYDLALLTRFTLGRTFPEGLGNGLWVPHA